MTKKTKDELVEEMDRLETAVLVASKRIALEARTLLALATRGAEELEQEATTLERYQKCAQWIWNLFVSDPLGASPAQLWIERLEALLERGLIAPRNDVVQAALDVAREHGAHGEMLRRIADLRAVVTVNPREAPPPCNLGTKGCGIKHDGSTTASCYPRPSEAGTFVDERGVRRECNGGEPVNPFIPRRQYKRGDRVRYRGSIGTVEDVMRAQPERLHVVFGDKSQVTVPSDSSLLEPESVRAPPLVFTETSEEGTRTVIDPSPHVVAEPSRRRDCVPGIEVKEHGDHGWLYVTERGDLLADVRGRDVADLLVDALERRRRTITLQTVGESLPLPEVTEENERRRQWVEERHALVREIERLRTVIRTGGAMYRAERAVLGIPGGHDPEQEAPAPTLDPSFNAVMDLLTLGFPKLGERKGPDFADALVTLIRQECVRRAPSHRRVWGVIEKWLVKHGLREHAGTVAHEELTNQIRLLVTVER